MTRHTLATMRHRPQIRRPLAVAATLALALAAAAGCSSSKPATSSAQAPLITPTPLMTSAAPATPSPAAAPHDPQTYDGAKAAAEKMEAALARHDAATFWDYLTASGKELMPKADYVYVFNHCAVIGTAEHVVSLSVNDSNMVATVTVTVPESQGGGEADFQMIYENGFWKHQPSSGASGWMSLSRDKALADLKASDAC